MATRCEGDRSVGCDQPTCARASCRRRAAETSVESIEAAMHGEPEPPAWLWVLAAAALFAGAAWFA
jgi:hypothetical protein